MDRYTIVKAVRNGNHIQLSLGGRHSRRAARPANGSMVHNLEVGIIQTFGAI
jgi:hypothetical protein